MRLPYLTSALTVCQPWAWAIDVAGKDIENRSWPTKFRGLLILHAGLSRTYMGGLRAADYPGCPPVPPVESLVFGAALAVVEVVDCVRFTAGLSPWAEGPWCWRLRKVASLSAPVPMKGSQGLWIPQRGDIDLINERLREVAV